jgi:hypothetical protein
MFWIDVEKEKPDKNDVVNGYVSVWWLTRYIHLIMPVSFVDEQWYSYHFDNELGAMKGYIITGVERWIPLEAFNETNITEK